MNRPDDRKIRADASATLYELLSVAFAYPGDEFISALTHGELNETLKQCTAILDIPVLNRAASDFQRSTRDHLEELDPGQLQSDYIALFEANPSHRPLHPNAHLYLSGTPEPVAVYQHLIARYRDFGVELRDDAAVERPDHLTVQLEFMAYLYRLLGESCGDESNRGSEDIVTAIAAFRNELDWIKAWQTALEQRGGHPLYSALAGLLKALIENR